MGFTLLKIPIPYHPIPLYYGMGWDIHGIPIKFHPFAQRWATTMEMVILAKFLEVSLDVF